MKKYTLTAFAILSAITLSAQTQEVQPSQEVQQSPAVQEAPKAASSKQFSSYGSSWIELDMGANTMSYKGGDDTGFKMIIDANYAAYKNDTFGIDVGLYGTYSAVELGDSWDIESTELILEIRPYVNLLQNDSVVIKYFFNPFFGYRSEELTVGFFNRSDDFLVYGIRTGFEISFLEDFNLSIAYKYKRCDSNDSNIDNTNSDIVEIGAAYRFTKSISLHLKYEHEFEQGIFEMTEDNILVGLRYTF